MNRIFQQGYKISSWVTALVMVVPLCFVFSSIAGVESHLWQTLWQGRIPRLMSQSLMLVLSVTICSLVVGFALAWIVEKSDFPARRWMRPLLIAPIIIPCYITTISYTSFLGRQGLLEQICSALGLNVSVGNMYGFHGAVFMLTLGAFPYVFTILSAAMRRMDPSLVEAARCLGADWRSRLKHIDVPLLFPAIMAAVTLCALYVLSDFGVVSTVRYQTFVSAIYEQISGRYNYSTATALSLFLIILTMGFLLVQERFVKRHANAPAARIGQTKLVKLGIWTLPCMFVVIAVIVLGLMIPFGVLVYWWIASFGITGQEMIWSISLSEVLRSAVHSVGVSVITATLAVALALPLAYWSAKSGNSKIVKALTWTSQMGIALPGILIALGISLMFVKIWPALNFSVLSMTAAMLVHFFAQAFQPVRTGFLQVSKSYEESAVVLGCSSWGVFWSVTSGLLRPSLWVGWMLVFLSVIRELPASLLLRPAGFDTLTVKVWNAASEGFYAQAAFPALMLVILSLPLLFAILMGKGDQYTYE